MNLSQRLPYFCIIVCYCICLAEFQSSGSSLSQFDPPHRRFEYKYSFKGPYLAQKDGAVPFWQYEGSAIASEEMVRITPSLKSKKGAIWSRLPTSVDYWEVELWFRVNGRGRLGADGLSFWFTDSKLPEGPVFGSSDYWRGLAVFFDSFDNDAKGNNPTILAMINDGTKSYDHQTDGFNQQVGSCLRDFRNKPFPVRAKLEYYKNVLTVLFHSGNSNNDDEYELCIRVENVVLPARGFFGISAATGGLADDHDVLKFLTYSLHAPGSQPTATAVPGIGEKEKELVNKEYELYKEKLEKQKEDYFRLHPDEARKLREHEDVSPDQEYETLGEKELQQIFSGQSQIFDVLRNLNRKLDEIIGRQERTLSIVGAIQGVGMSGHPPQGTGHGGPPAVLPAPIQRHEVETLLQLQQELVRTSREMRGSGGQPTSQQAAGDAVNQVNQQLLNEIRDSVNVLRKDLGNIGTRVMAAPAAITSCPTVSCISPTYFLVVITVHLAVVLGYLILRNSGSNNSKKLY